MKNNIVLIGFMGCGKTTVGKELAKALEYRFVDTDEFIETQTKKSISDIFATQGEEYFRILETDTIANMRDTLNCCVISTGGGLPLREVNAGILLKTGFVVYLRVQKETVEERLRGDTKRPLLQGGQVSEKIEKLLTYRDPIYECGAHMVLDVDEKSIEELVEEIIRNYKLLHAKEEEESV